MQTLRRLIILAAAILVGVVQLASAQALPAASAPGLAGRPPRLLGTTGACKNPFPGGPCTQQSTLVELDPQTGALIRTIGPVGFTVNGLVWDQTSGKLYASTAVGDVVFHGLITIHPNTGAGKPVDKNAINFGLPGEPSPVHSITIDLLGRMVGWYDVFPPPVGVTDSFVQINKFTGVATEFPDTGINTSQNGLSFSGWNLLWNIDSPRRHLDGTLTQTAYLINPVDGKPIFSRLLSPPTAAALVGFNPVNDLYYRLNFDSSSPSPFLTFIVVVDPLKGTVSTLGETVDDLHTLTFVP
jgi:hypothetical protein